MIIFEIVPSEGRGFSLCGTTDTYGVLAMTVERGYGRIYMIISEIVPSEGRGFSLCGTTDTYGVLAMTTLSPVIASESRAWRGRAKQSQPFNLETIMIELNREIASSSRPSSMAGPPRNDSREGPLRGAKYTGIAASACGGLAMTVEGNHFSDLDRRT